MMGDTLGMRKLQQKMAAHRSQAAVTALGIACAVLTASHAAAQSNEPIKPIPIESKWDVRKAALGEKLFNDRRLSKNNSVACISCHNLSGNGADKLPFSVGINGSKGEVNSPTVFNSALNFRQFWDGRAATLEEQVTGPVHNPIEMGSDWKEVIGKLSKDSALVSDFKAAYPEGLQIKNIEDAIGVFERSLNTPNARFDKYLRGDKNAISTDELRGYQLFKAYGCVACHQGVNVGGNMFQTFGVMGDYFAKRGNLTEADNGRFNVTQKPADKHVFKVPSLRNVAVTAPYFHDGSATTLADAVDVMFQFQLGRPASDADKAFIIKFLNTLSGEYKGKPLEALIAK